MFDDFSKSRGARVGDNGPAAAAVNAARDRLRRLAERQFAASAGKQQQTPARPLAPRGFRGGGSWILQQKE
ncbi:MAG: hypothetical protein AB7H71_00300 [Alphaproteobacteria bacterium]